MRRPRPRPRRRPKLKPITNGYAGKYRVIIRNLWRHESHVRGADRRGLGIMALGIAMFLRRRACRGRDRAKIFALIAQARRIAELCILYPEPRGEA